MMNLPCLILYDFVTNKWEKKNVILTFEHLRKENVGVDFLMTNVMQTSN